MYRLVAKTDRRAYSSRSLGEKYIIILLEFIFIYKYSTRRASFFFSSFDNERPPRSRVISAFDWLRFSSNSLHSFFLACSLLLLLSLFRFQRQTRNFLLESRFPAASLAFLLLLLFFFGSDSCDLLVRRRSVKKSMKRAVLLLWECALIRTVRFVNKLSTRSCGKRLLGNRVK